MDLLSSELDTSRVFDDARKSKNPRKIGYQYFTKEEKVELFLQKIKKEGKRGSDYKKANKKMDGKIPISANNSLNRLNINTQMNRNFSNLEDTYKV